MTPESADGPPRRSSSADWVVLDGQAAIHDRDGDHYHVLDTTATAVWLRLDGTAGLDEIAVGLAHDFGADLDRVRADTAHFVEGLRTRGLLEPTRREPAAPTWSRAPGSVWRDTARGTLVLADEPEPVLLRGGAVPLWALLDRPRPVELLASVLSEAAGVDVAEVEPGVRATLADLEGRGLVART